MPTILLIKGYRFFFYVNEHLPKHIHVERDNKTAKLELSPVKLVKSKRFSASELKQIRNLVEENLEILIQKWDEYFNYQ
ncbi:MAG: DUF4160 domain-containing protein [Chitinophagaceae bacterium]